MEITKAADAEAMVIRTEILHFDDIISMGQNSIGFKRSQYIMSRLIYSDFTLKVGHSPMTPAQVCSISTTVEEKASKPYACASS